MQGGRPLGPLLNTTRAVKRFDLLPNHYPLFLGESTLDEATNTLKLRVRYFHLESKQVFHYSHPADFLPNAIFLTTMAPNSPAFFVFSKVIRNSLSLSHISPEAE
jgi:hypothetical protein